MPLVRKLFLGLLALGAIGWFLVQLRPPQLDLTDTPAYDFHLRAFPSGSPVSLGSHAGKVRLVAFWASWCGPCLQEIPTLKDLQARFGPRGFQVLAISIDEDTLTNLPAAMRTNGIDYPVLLADKATIDAYGPISSIPASFLIDQQGRFIAMVSGMVDGQSLSNQIELALRSVQGPQPR